MSILTRYRLWLYTKPGISIEGANLILELTVAVVGFIVGAVVAHTISSLR